MPEIKWLTEREALAYGGLSYSALKSRRQRGTLPVRKEANKYQYQEGPWLLPTPTTLLRQPPKASKTFRQEETLPSKSQEEPSQLFPREEVPPETGDETWVFRALQAMDPRIATTLARQMVLCHPQLPVEVKSLILEFWQEDAR
jgi:hypothetical protein